MHRGRKAGGDRVGGTAEGHEGRNVGHCRVVDQSEGCRDDGHAIARVRTCGAHTSQGTRAVAHAVSVGIRVERVGPSVGAVDVDAGVGFHAVGKAISVVVAVGHKTGGRSFRRVVIAWQVVGKTVPVEVRKALQVERERLVCTGTC